MDKKVIDKVILQIKEEGLDALLVAPSQDMVYVMGASPHLCERFQGLIIKADGGCFYISNLVTADEVKKMLNNEIKVYTWWDGDNFVDKTIEILNQEGLGGKVIGTSEAVKAFHALSIMHNSDIIFKDAKDLIDKSCICKSEEELECLRKAAEIADQAFMQTLKKIHPGMTEGQIRDIAFGLMVEFGGHDPDGLVSSGPNTGFPHYFPLGDGRTVLEKDVILFDFGCRYKGYQSDMSRTVFIGEASEKERKIYEIVKKANQAGEDAVFEGAYIPDIDKAARQIIEDAGYGKTFITRLGHGIGRNVHEAPDIKQSNKMHLKRGMAFSIEPGIYLANEFGIRIEDIVVVNEHGEREILNKTSKDLIVI